jgi:hypothetical protein
MLVPAAGAGAAVPLPAPGPAPQVRELVASSTSIKTLPAKLVPSLWSASSDLAGNLYPVTRGGCQDTTQCVFGDLSSKTTVVLYGDSHAQMWLPALAPVALRQGFRLVVIWTPACPVAEVAIGTSGGCDQFRKTAIKAIVSLDPTLVLLANRTTSLVSPSGKLIKKRTWEEGLEATIEALQSTSTSVAVIGDVTQFNAPVPTCLAAHATKVQKCAVPYENPAFTQKFATEWSAAQATGAGYVNTRTWLCASLCSPVIGDMVVYADKGHVSASYAEYLTDVWNTRVRSLLRGAGRHRSGHSRRLR